MVNRTDARPLQCGAAFGNMVDGSISDGVRRMKSRRVTRTGRGNA